MDLHDPTALNGDGDVEDFAVEVLSSLALKVVLDARR